MTLPFSLDRTVDIRARRATVFRFFTDSARFARWWGAGSTIDPTVGGAIKIVYPDGSTASGIVRELVMDARIAFTYGYDDPKKSIAPGGSLVTITLEDTADGTRVILRHDVDSAAVRDDHVQGWRHVLALFAKVASDDAQLHAPDTVATWYSAWSEPDPARCRDLLAAITTSDVSFRDAFGCALGRDELAIHIAACQRFMPGLRLEARGKPRHAHGTVVSDWATLAPDGTAVTSGTNVFRFNADSLIAEIVGVAA